MGKDVCFETILLLGPTAAGKTPLGDTISSKGIDGQRCFHFDFGNELRTVAGSADSAHLFKSDEINFIRGVLEKGLLLEDERFYLAKKIFHAFVGREKVGTRDSVIMNGLPRHVGQAEGMRDVVNVKTVVELACSRDNIVCRINENTGGDRTDREDDHHELVMKKIDIYTQRTAPLIEYYRDQRSQIIRIEVAPESSPLSMYDEFLTKCTPQRQNVP